MFLDTSKIPVCSLLEANLELLDRMLERIAPEEFVPWVLGDAYRGRWSLFGLVQDDDSWVLVDAFRRGGADPRFRELMALIRRVPVVLSSCFMQLDPGAHIYPHIDDPRVHSVRVLLPLRTNPFAKMRVGEEIRTLERGRCCAFDSAVLHEAANEGATPRIVFGIEVPFGRESDPLHAAAATA